MNSKKMITGSAAAVVAVAAIGGAYLAGSAAATSSPEPQAQASQAPAPGDVVVGSADVVEAETPEDQAPGLVKVAVGETASVGDWDVTITQVVLDADQHLQQVNQFNDAPVHQHMLLTFEATYTGTGTGDIDWDLDWQFAGADNVLYDYASIVTEADSDDWPEETRPGGTLTWQQVFDVPPSVVEGGSFLLEIDRDLVAEFSL